MNFENSNAKPILTILALLFGSHGFGTTRAFAGKCELPLETVAIGDSSFRVKAGIPSGYREVVAIGVNRSWFDRLPDGIFAQRPQAAEALSFESCPGLSDAIRRSL